MPQGSRSTAPAARTPMFRQYQSIKQGHPDAILLFRMGDFYEMFYDDARRAAQVLQITLTARGKGTANVVPMCGFPHHQLAPYTARLVGSGLKVAVCEQLEDPRKTKGLVKRDVVRVVTPGTVTDPEQLDARTHLWLAAVVGHGTRTACAFLDASTGDFLTWESEAGTDGWPALADRLLAFEPREIVYPEEAPWIDRLTRSVPDGATLTATEPFAFAADEAQRILQEHFDVASLDGFGLRGRELAAAAASGLLGYLRDTQRSSLDHVDRLLLHQPETALLLDPATRRNLEIERSLRGGDPKGSLLQTVDRTVTGAGGRLLRDWLLAPLVQPAAINERLDAVEELRREADARRSLRDWFSGVHDIERLVTRAVTGTANARDLQALATTLERLPELRKGVSRLEASLARSLADAIDPCDELADELIRGLAEQPPVSLREGGLIRDGYDVELDDLRTLRRDGRAYLAAIETREREATGISNLKVKFNKVFGYFIEVSKSNLHLVPDPYERKQTIAGGERFVTAEIKEYESKVLTAQERIEELEYEIFCRLRVAVAAQAGRLKASARALAAVDVLGSFAELAEAQDYCRPAVDDGSVLELVQGRHPVVEQQLVGERFIPNDTRLEGAGEALAILTGPNMGGKSTYLRQVALIVLLGQAGSFVPAEQARFGVVDRVFCRVGASDSLAEGQSTFMVEMSETANILHHATARSLVLLDEIGRGTSTFDGLSIAWAVVEHLAAATPHPPRTLFATHYHELTELAVERPSVINVRMAVKESAGKVLFLHRVERGATDRSYGIHVARLAGVPDPIVARAREILCNLERDEYGRDGLPRRARRRRGAAPSSQQLGLFTGAAGSLDPPADAPAEDPAAAEVLAELRSKDPDRMTPLEALDQLSRWSRRLGRRED